MPLLTATGRHSPALHGVQGTMLQTTSVSLLSVVTVCELFRCHGQSWGRSQWWQSSIACTLLLRRGRMTAARVHVQKMLGMQLQQQRRQSRRPSGAALTLLRTRGSRSVSAQAPHEHGPMQDVCGARKASRSLQERGAAHICCSRYAISLQELPWPSISCPVGCQLLLT